METYNIPLFKLNYGDEEISAVTETIRSKWISMGPKCEELEVKFAEMLGVKYALAVSTCTAALHMACCCLGIGEGDEVICPSLTFVATINCIKYVGATPVFCDVASIDDFGLDVIQLEKLITSRTKAIIPMHFAGYPCNMDTIMSIAKKHHLFVIEDACHGPLSTYKKKCLGTIGDLGCFSFFSNKNISTGEGGMVVTNDTGFYEKLKSIRSHGMTSMSYQRASGHATSYDVTILGYNYRLDDIRASLACVQLDKLKKDLEKRKIVRSWYEDRLNKIEDVTIPYWDNKEFVSNYILPVVLRKGDFRYRDNIRMKLANKGIQTSVHYPAAHRFSIYSDLRAMLPVTEYITDHEITLPMYSELSEIEVDYICDNLAEAVKDDKCCYSML